MTTIQIVSDLHIEYKNDEVPNPLDLITPSADILVLAGDIGSLYKLDQLKQFLEELCKHFEVVLYTPGNHEYYSEQGYDPVNLCDLNERLKQIEKSIDKLYILNRSSVKLDNDEKICITGVTLWSKPLVPIPKYLVRINNITTHLYQNMYEEDRKYLEKMIRWCEDNDYKLIVVTHYCPTYKVLEGSKKHKKFFSLYATDLNELLDKRMVHTWICGHVHKNFDFKTEGGTRVVSNQKGKPKDHIKDYHKDFTIAF